MKRSIISDILLLGTAIIWGFTFVAQAWGAEHLAPLTFNGIRFFVGALSLLPVILLFERNFSDKKRLRRTMLAALAAGTALFTAAALQQMGIDHTQSAGVAGFITGLYNLMTPIAYFLLFKKRTGLTVWIGAIISVVGLFFLCVNEEGFSFGIGELYLFLGTFFWTAHILIIDRFVDFTDPIKLSCGQFFIASALNFVFAFVFERAEFSVENIGKAWGAILFCGILAAGVAYTCQIFGQKYAKSPTEAAIILSTESIFGAVGGVLFGIDDIPMIGYFGCALIFVGIILSQLPSSLFKRKRK